MTTVECVVPILRVARIDARRPFDSWETAAG